MTTRRGLAGPGENDAARGRPRRLRRAPGAAPPSRPEGGRPSLPRSPGGGRAARGIVRFARTPGSAVWFSPSAPQGADHPGRLAQRESASFTPKRSLVRSQYRPPRLCRSGGRSATQRTGLSLPLSDYRSGGPPFHGSVAPSVHPVEPDVEDRIVRPVAEVRIDLQAWQGRPTEESRADERDAVSIQDLGDLFAAFLPCWDRHFGDGIEPWHGVEPATVGEITRGGLALLAGPAKCAGVR